MRQWFGVGTVGIALLVSGCSADGDDSTRTFGRGASTPAGHDDASSAPSSDGSSASIDTSSPSDGAGKSSGVPASEGATPSVPSSAPPSDPVTGNGGQKAEPGVLTAGAWDDNRNFSRFLGYRSGLAALDLPGLTPITEDELNTAHELWVQAPAPKQTLDVSLIIDTTGSMGDEITYLQAEFQTLSKTIAMNHPDAQQRWALVLYKDVGDSYVTQQFDFTTDAAKFSSKLGTVHADGGGDFPEAPDQAFAAARQLAWSSQGSTAKLAFWVADAPHHTDKAAAMADGIRGMSNLGVHVYPVASSGVDELTEATMRTAAALTGGRYLFLTNDSGVGGDHKEPTIPCYFVTKLNVAIERMVDIELSGTYREPDPSEVLRTGGDPKDGACALESGESVLVF
ncbi:MAG TPA: VWA domain-containing protein [Polyangiaceae bacterium]|nr:VWA domain-containing protein [Polyangiaceae bacterium]